MKRIIMILVAVLAVCLACVAMADTEIAYWGQLQEALSAGGTIILTQDVKAVSSSRAALEVPEGKTVTLDLHGYNIDRDGLPGYNDIVCSVIKVNGKLTVKDTVGGGKISGGNCTYGGGIYVSKSGILYLEGGCITGNQAEFGGGIYVENAGYVSQLPGGVLGGVCSIASGASVARNHATKAGGGIYVKTSDNASARSTTLGISGSVTDNTAVNAGGGIFVYGGSVTMGSGSCISDNTAKNGGGIFASSGDVRMYGGIIKSNHATGDETRCGLGGGVYCSSLTMTGGSITDNTADGTIGGSSVPVAGAYISSFYTYGNVTLYNNWALGRQSNLYSYAGKNFIYFHDEFNSYGYLSSTSLIGITPSSLPTESEPVRITVDMAGRGKAENFMLDQGPCKISVETRADISSNKEVYLLQGMTWADLQNKFDTTTGVKLTNDINAGPNDSGLVCQRVNQLYTFNLDLNGYTIDRGLTNSEAQDDGYVIMVNGGRTLKINDSKGSGKIVGGNNTGNGGGILVNKGSALTMNGGSITCNQATQGGGIYFAGSSEESGITAGTISFNHATRGGGIFYEKGSELKFNGGNIEYNIAEQGGGVFLTGSGFTISSGSIHHNTATQGGGVYAENLTNSQYGTTVMNSGSITSNNADLGGGVFLKGQGTFTMTGGSVSDNTATANGGGVYAMESASFTQSGGAITENTAGENGGGSYLVNTDYPGQYTMSGGTLTNNSAGVNGGGIYHAGRCSFSGNVTILNNTVNEVANNMYLTGNRTIPIGGALHKSTRIGYTREDMDSTGYLTSGLKNNGTVDNFVSDDEAYMTLYEYGTDATVYKKLTWASLQEKIDTSSYTVLFNDIIATDSDGPLVIPANSTFHIEFNHHTIDRGLASQAARENGEVFLIESNAKLRLSYSGTITGGNNIGNGGGILVNGGELELGDVTVTGNSALNGGGVYATEDSSVILKHDCIITGNVAAENGGGIGGLGSITLTNGTADIKENIRNRDNTENNLYLTAGNKLHTEGTFNWNYGNIGITSEATPSLGNPVVLTDGWKNSTSATNILHYDNNNFEITYDSNGEAQLLIPMTWSDLQSALNAGGNVELTNNVLAEETDSSLTVPADVSVNLDLHNYIIDRGLGDKTPQENGSIFTAVGTLILCHGQLTGGNTAGNGGGILVDGGNVSLNDIALYANQAQNGGAIYLDGGSLQINDNVTINDNSAIATGAGIYADGTISVSGTGINVTLNQITDELACNLFLPDTRYLTVTGSLNDSEIGITTQTAPADNVPIVLTSSFGQEDYSVFTSDDLAYVILMNAQGEVILSLPVIVMDDPDFILPTSLLVIEDEAFCGIKAQVVYIPDGTERICSGAFSGCSSLRQIRIPGSVTFIDPHAFDGIETLIIFGDSNSAAETFADGHADYRFVVE